MRHIPAIRCWLKSKLKLWKGPNTLWSKSRWRTQCTITVQSSVFLYIWLTFTVSPTQTPGKYLCPCGLCAPHCVCGYLKCRYSLPQLIQSCPVLQTVALLGKDKVNLEWMNRDHSPFIQVSMQFAKYISRIFLYLLVNFLSFVLEKYCCMHYT